MPLKLDEWDERAPNVMVHSNLILSSEPLDFWILIIRHTVHHYHADSSYPSMYSLETCAHVHVYVGKITKKGGMGGYRKCTGGYSEKYQNIWGAGGTPFSPQAPMHFALPTPGLDLPCMVRSFTGIPVVADNPHPQYEVLMWTNLS